MGKEKYSGYSDFQKINNIGYDTQKDWGNLRNTICQQAKDVGLYLFGLDGRSETGRFNVNPKWLKSLFATAKMISILEQKKQENIEFVKKFKDEKRISEHYEEKLLKGERFDAKALYESNDGLRISYDEIDLINKYFDNYNEYSQFEEDLKATDNTYGRYLYNKDEKIDTKKLVEKSLEYFGLNKEEIDEVFDISYIKKGEKLRKLSDASIEKYDEQFSNFMNKVEDFKEAKIKEILEKQYADEISDQEIANELDNPLQVNDENVAIEQQEVDEAVEMAKAARINVEMEKRLNNSIIKKIPIIRWFSKEFREERALLNKTNETLSKYPNIDNLKNYIKAQNFKDAYGIVEPVAKAKYQEALKELKGNTKDDSVIKGRRKLTLEEDKEITEVSQKVDKKDPEVVKEKGKN